MKRADIKVGAALALAPTSATRNAWDCALVRVIAQQDGSKRVYAAHSFGGHRSSFKGFLVEILWMPKGHWWNQSEIGQQILVETRNLLDTWSNYAPQSKALIRSSVIHKAKKKAEQERMDYAVERAEKLCGMKVDQRWSTAGTSLVIKPEDLLRLVEAYARDRASPVEFEPEPGDADYEGKERY